jgi:hypothetical protein
LFFDIRNVTQTDMGIKDIQSKFGNKYDVSIKEMQEYTNTLIEKGAIK